MNISSILSLCTHYYSTRVNLMSRQSIFESQYRIEKVFCKSYFIQTMHTYINSQNDEGTLEVKAFQ